MPASGMPAALGEEIAEAALRAALADRCCGGSWRGLVRGLAWRLVAGGERDPRSIEQLAEAAEAIFCSLVDDALWAVEQTAVAAYEEFLAARPGDATGAAEAARLDAAEESARLVEEACGRVVDALLSRTRRAA